MSNDDHSPAVMSEPENSQPRGQTISTGNVEARNGAVAIGVAQDGAAITVYNLSVSDAVVKRLARQGDLSTERAEKATRQFLDFVENYYRYLPLKGMGDNSGLRLRFPLVELYIPLNARLTLPKGDTLDEGLRIAGRNLTDEERTHIGGRLDQLQPVLTLIQNHPVVVMLGDPGSGKSTVVKLLAFLLATGQGDALGLADYLPLLLPLAAYSEKLETQPNLNLRRFAEEYFEDYVDVDDLSPLLEAKLKQGKVLILLDGLDEVKELSQRNTVVDRVHRFLCQHVKEGNRVIMTSRIIGYREVRPPAIEGLKECTLLDFEAEEIEQFVRRWTVTIERQAYEDGNLARSQAKREADELLAVIEENAAVRKLASNPLLLTMLVVQKRQGVSLPRHRVLLYEQYIVSLLRDWLLARSLHDSPRDLPNDRALRKVLEPLAFWLQDSEPGKGVVNEGALMSWLENRYSKWSDPDEAAVCFIRDVREHSGLLIDRGGKRFGFLHLTFMEYLAGADLANQFQRSGGEGRRFIIDCITQHAHESEWRETILLALGYLGLKLRFDEATTDVLQSLLDQDAYEPGAHHEIVAAALSDMGEDGVTPEGWQALRRQLVENGLRNEKVPARRRVNIGAELTEMGDPRLEVLNVDAMTLCFVPEGPFFLGSTDEDTTADKWEKKGAGDHLIDYPYWLARFPVTVAQFQKYVNETGAELEGFEWQCGAVNTPVVSLIWDEATAFCAWLTRCWREKGWLPDGYHVTLPSEPEWEKAAKGGHEIPAPDEVVIASIAEVAARHTAITEMPLTLAANPAGHRRYPWIRNDYEEKMNYDKNIGVVAAVGAYPGGTSPYGCEEMSGNVWEWTRSFHKSYPYPEDATGRQKREHPGLGARALRGESFFDDQEIVRCAYRNSRNAHNRSDNIGFRVVVSTVPLRDMERRSRNRVAPGIHRSAG